MKSALFIPFKTCGAKKVLIRNGLLGETKRTKYNAGWITF